MSTGSTALTDRKARAWVWPALFSLVAFAANSVFCRLALKEGAIDPASFTVVRLASQLLVERPASVASVTTGRLPARWMTRRCCS